MDIPIRTHRRNMTARSDQAKMAHNDRMATKINSRPPRSPLKGVFGGKRSSSAPARIGRRHLLVEDHYRVDPVDKRLLPGLPVNDEDWARDMHDFFNLVALVSSCFVSVMPYRLVSYLLSRLVAKVPVVVLNFMNWNWVSPLVFLKISPFYAATVFNSDHTQPLLKQDILLDPNSKKNIQNAWSGDWFSLFFAVVIGYFLADLIWVISIPKCVKSPVSITAVACCGSQFCFLTYCLCVWPMDLSGCHYPTSHCNINILNHTVPLPRGRLVDGGVP